MNNVMIGSIGATGVNSLGDIYIFGYYMKPSKGLKYYITVKRLGGGKRQTLLTTQIFEKTPSSENMYKSAVEAASAAGLIPQYKTGDPVKFWEKHGGNKNHIVFNQFLYMSSKFNKSHRSEGRVTSI
jgi:hypothetical protein